MQGNSPQGNKVPSLSWSQPASSSKSAAPTGTSKTPTKPPAPPTPSISTTGGRGKLVGAFVAGLIVGILAGWGWFALRGEEGIATSTSNATTSLSGTPLDTSGAQVGAVAAAGDISIGSPSVGTKITVSGVHVTRPTWVVIYDNNNGKTGNALGAKLFGRGTTSGTITLLRATKSGQTYLLGLNLDDGDAKFSKQKDTPVGEPRVFTAR